MTSKDPVVLKSSVDDFKQRLSYVTSFLVTHYGGKSDNKSSGEFSSHKLNFSVGAAQAPVDRFLVVWPPPLTTSFENGPPRKSINLIRERYDATKPGAS